MAAADTKGARLLSGLAPAAFQITQWIILVGALKAAAERIEAPSLDNLATILKWIIVYHIGRGSGDVLGGLISEARMENFIKGKSLPKLLLILISIAIWTVGVYFFVNLGVNEALELSLRLADSVSKP